MIEAQGTIVKAMSGFYYVDCGGEIINCRARGKFRNEKASPLVGDKVRIVRTEDNNGRLEEIFPRKNMFLRPSVANIDVLVIFAAAVNPITEPFLIDRVAALAICKGVSVVLCINKSDLNRGESLKELYADSGFSVINTSAETGEGLDELVELMANKVCAFTGNSGVGKSSVLNRIQPDLAIKTGEVSEKLGRGRHTTRHTELFSIGKGTLAADTPGFSSFDIERMEMMEASKLQYAYGEFAPWLGDCMFADCSHTKEKGCAVLAALKDGKIHPKRHESYVKLYEFASQIRPWEFKTK